MMDGSVWRRYGLWIVVFVAAAGCTGILFFVTRSGPDARLFEGPAEICMPEPPVYTAPVDYNLAEYEKAFESRQADSAMSGLTTQSPQDEISYVDGESRAEVEAILLKGARNQGPADREKIAADSRLISPSSYRERCPSQRLQILSPEDGAVFPPNLCAPYIEWEDPRNQFWQIVIRAGDGPAEHRFVSDTQRWRIPAPLWRQIGSRPGASFEVVVRGVQADESGARVGPVQETPPLHLQISTDPADDFIVYRFVDPPFSSLKTPNIYIRDIRKDEPELFLASRRQYCFNCHTFTSMSGKNDKLAMQVRYLGDEPTRLPVYLAIFDFDRGVGRKVQLPFEIQMTTFMSWSPDSRQLAYSANQKIVAIHPVTFDTQLAGMATSDIAVYDVETNETWLVPGASDPNFMEIYPRWTPDGRSLVFSRSAPGPHPAEIQFDLYRVDLTASAGAQAVPVEGASRNGRSNYYARFSPDGKWLSFNQCDGGDLIRSSSDLYLLPADGSGPARRLECNADYAADSWHSWSSNSRWLVFPSKRAGGVYASLCLAHVDENGHASPAVALPVETSGFASCNIPEFVAYRPRMSEKELFSSLSAEAPPVAARLRTTSGGSGS